MAYDNAGEANPRRVHCYSDEDMLGRVKKILKGTRYTVAIWFTQDFAHIEI